MKVQVYIAHYLAKVVVEKEKTEVNLDTTNYTREIQTSKQTQNEQDTWVPSLENWDSGLNVG